MPDTPNHPPDQAAFPDIPRSELPRGLQEVDRGAVVVSSARLDGSRLDRRQRVAWGAAAVRTAVENTWDTAPQPPASAEDSGAHATEPNPAVNTELVDSTVGSETERTETPPPTNNRTNSSYLGALAGPAVRGTDGSSGEPLERGMQSEGMIERPSTGEEPDQPPEPQSGGAGGDSGGRKPPEGAGGVDEPGEGGEEGFNPREEYARDALLKAERGEGSGAAFEEQTRPDEDFGAKLRKRLLEGAGRAFIESEERPLTKQPGEAPISSEEREVDGGDASVPHGEKLTGPKPEVNPLYEQPDSEVFYEWQSTRDPEAGYAIIAAYEGLAVAIAAPMRGVLLQHRSVADMDDLKQHGVEHILRAARSFDPAKGVRFSTYVWRSLGAEIRKHDLNMNGAVKIPPGEERRAMLRVMIENTERAQSGKPMLTETEVAELIGLPLGQRDSAVAEKDSDPLTARGLHLSLALRDAGSLEHASPEELDRASVISSDPTSRPEYDLETVERRRLAHDLFEGAFKIRAGEENRVVERQRRVLAALTGSDGRSPQTIKAIAAELTMTPASIRRILKDAKDRVLKFASEHP